MYYCCNMNRRPNTSRVGAAAADAHYFVFGNDIIIIGEYKLHVYWRQPVGRAISITITLSRPSVIVARVPTTAHGERERKITMYKTIRKLYGKNRTR